MLIVAQLALVTLCGAVSKDAWYVILISVIGVVFNFLVSERNPLGLWFGCVYALTNGTLAFYTGAYATFMFMIFLQAPMAVYSFFSWKKKAQSQEDVLKKMPVKGVALMIFAMILLGIIMMFVLKNLNSSAILVDDIFFVFSVTACVLLAVGYQNAYVVTLLSGLGGTALWLYQMLQTGVGLSIAVFYVIVSVNSVMAICKSRSKKKIQV